MTKDEALKKVLVTLEWFEERKHLNYFDWQTQHIADIKEALAQPEQDDRRLQIALRQWEDWKAYALELQKKLVKYEGGSPMILNTQPQEKNT